MFGIVQSVLVEAHLGHEAFNAAHVVASECQRVWEEGHWAMPPNKLVGEGGVAGQPGSR